MSSSALKDSQLAMARYLRDPAHMPAPEGVEARRLNIYRDLIYNNVEGFISGGFPVLRSLYHEDDWHSLVRSFIEVHRCHSPYFLEISQEFLQYLMSEHQQRSCDPPFMSELAHYEWVELALDVSQEEHLESQPVDDPLQAIPQLSPLAWLLSYRFPVHRIGPGFRPTEAAELTYLVVYRDHQDEVRFMELNAATARLVELIRDNLEARAGLVLLSALAGELGMEETSVQAFGGEQLAQLIEQGIVAVRLPEPEAQ